MRAADTAARRAVTIDLGDSTPDLVHLPLVQPAFAVVNHIMTGTV
jgi:hypothetical protein